MQSSNPNLTLLLQILLLETVISCALNYTEYITLEVQGLTVQGKVNLYFKCVVYKQQGEVLVPLASSLFPYTNSSKKSVVELRVNILIKQYVEVPQ